MQQKGRAQQTLAQGCTFRFRCCNAYRCHELILLGLSALRDRGINAQHETGTTHTSNNLVLTHTRRLELGCRHMS